MGGKGSGRWIRNNSKMTTDQVLNITIKMLNDHGCLCPGAQGYIHLDHHCIQAITFHTQENVIILKYRYNRFVDNCYEIQTAIKIEHQPLHFGGHRSYFVCPDCGRKVTALFFMQMIFRCRSCHLLTYRSQQLCKINRSINKIKNIHNHLGCYTNAFDSIPAKPWYMHKQKYFRMCADEQKTKDELVESIISRFGT